MTIIVEGKTISDIQNGYIIPATNDKIIDLKNRTVMQVSLIAMCVEGRPVPIRLGIQTKYCRYCF
jgi:hypothetical protein